MNNMNLILLFSSLRMFGKKKKKNHLILSLNKKVIDFYSVSLKLNKEKGELDL